MSITPAMLILLGFYWFYCVSAVAAGVALGNLLTRRINATKARK